MEHDSSQLIRPQFSVLSFVRNHHIQNSTFTFKREINSTSDTKKKKKAKANGNSLHTPHLTIEKLSHKDPLKASRIHL